MTTRQLFLQNVAQTSDFPLALEIQKAEGIYLYGETTKYIDLISGIGVSNVGHRHPKVVEAIKNQVDNYMHLMVYGEYVQTPQVNLAEAICKTLVGTGLDNVYFTNSGTEAVEGAMKLAKRFTRRTNIVSCKKAYHGSTQGALSLGDEHFKRNFRPLLSSIDKIERNDFADLSKITHQTAAVFFEPVGGESGVREADYGYMQALRSRCDEVGALLVFDEIQSGFGRTGKFWAFEHYDVKPDILLCAKGMGGGMPIGAFIASHEIMGVLKDNPILGHITTFGGHPVSCAASLATLNAIFDENMLFDSKNCKADCNPSKCRSLECNFVEQKGQIFKTLLVHPKIKEVRGKGLMLAAEFESFEVLKPIIDRAIEKGVITDWFLYCDNSMRIAPPLIITEEQIRFACDVILSCIE
ncbi:aspartate aminotransferase family protein [Emticicia aquatilis]|uniref:Aspartate aminotransferase family protein n=1 Tax=Emticicia aquatilis TaxID=1537369 RepID=A0A916YLP9_9BACT|nr:aminotransferase class III-fold pyridoxal phosphate-dependent enzyme [Emticicia aquatilis]GGD50564.1 aspartate aminotransferase family protein [Emticicia aquatilis]